MVSAVYAGAPGQNLSQNTGCHDLSVLVIILSSSSQIPKLLFLRFLPQVFQLFIRYVPTIRCYNYSLRNKMHRYISQEERSNFIFCRMTV
jgi:hypothetical protein